MKNDIQTRRWMMDKRRHPKQMTEGNITPDEARTAVQAMLVEAGALLREVLEYDPHKDRFIVSGQSEESGKIELYSVPGESVAEIVMAARMISGMPSGLMRPGEAKAKGIIR